MYGVVKLKFPIFPVEYSVVGIIYRTSFSIYFMIHGAFKDFIESYFMFNMNSYTTILSLRERIHNMLWACYSELNYNYDIKYLIIIFRFL